ncbi:RNA polymerase sigma factor [Spirillospora sp. NBC_00431]
MASLFRAESPRLFAFACALTQGDRIRADDLVQQSFQAAALAWSELCTRDGNGKRAWLYRVLRNKEIDEWRVNRRLCSENDLEDGSDLGEVPDPSAQVLDLIAMQRCLALIAAMPPVRHRVAFLRWIEEWSVAEIAEQLAIDQSTVRGHLKKARDELLTDIGPQVSFLKHSELDDGESGAGRRGLS